MNKTKDAFWISCSVLLAHTNANYAMRRNNTRQPAVNYYTGMCNGILVIRKLERTQILSAVPKGLIEVAEEIYCLSHSESASTTISYYTKSSSISIFVA